MKVVFHSVDAVQKAFFVVDNALNIPIQFWSMFQRNGFNAVFCTKNKVVYNSGVRHICTYLIYVLNQLNFKFHIAFILRFPLLIQFLVHFQLYQIIHNYVQHFVSLTNHSIS